MPFLRWSTTLLKAYPTNTKRWPNVFLMLGRHRRRRVNIKTALVQCFVFAVCSTRGSDRLFDFWRQNLTSKVDPWAERMNPWSAELICKKHRNQRLFSSWNHHNCLSELFLIHLNTYGRVLRPLRNLFTLTVRGSTLVVRLTSRRQKVDPRSETIEDN